MKSSILFSFFCFFLIALVSSAPAGDQQDEPQNSPKAIIESKLKDEREKAVSLISNLLKSAEDPYLKKGLSDLSDFISVKKPETKTDDDDESQVTGTPTAEQDQDAKDAATHSLGEPAGDNEQEPKPTDESHAPETKPEEAQAGDSETKVPEENHEDTPTSPAPVSEAPAGHDDNDQDAKDAATHSLGESAGESQQEPKPTDDSDEYDEDVDRALKKLKDFLESKEGSELKKTLDSIDELRKEKHRDDDHESTTADSVDQDAKDAATHSLGEPAEETKPAEAQVPEQKPPGGIRGAIIGFSNSVRQRADARIKTALSFIP